MAAPLIGRRHERGFPPSVSPGASAFPSFAPGGPLQRNLGNRHVKRFNSYPAARRSRPRRCCRWLCSRRAKQGWPDDAEPVEVATRPGTRPPIGDPAPEQLPPLNGELVRVGDRVQFELDRYDLTPEARGDAAPAGGAAAELPEIVDHHRRACRRARDAGIQPRPGRAPRRRGAELSGGPRRLA